MQRHHTSNRIAESARACKLYRPQYTTTISVGRVLFEICFPIHSGTVSPPDRSWPWPLPPLDMALFSYNMFVISSKDFPVVFE